MAGLTLSSGPAAEPMTTAEAKTHLRVSGTDDDTYIDTLIGAARHWVELFTGRALIDQTWVLKLDKFPDSGCPIWLPKPPLSSVTSITYTDTDGNTGQTFNSANYDVDTASDTQLAGIYEGYNETWPDTRDEINSVTVTYVAGYGSAATSIPDPIVHACKLLVGRWYCTRASALVEPGGMIPSAQALLEPYRVHNTQFAEQIYG